ARVRRRLADVHRAVGQALDGRAAGGRHRVARPEPLLGEEASRDGRDEGRVEGGEAGELDADVVAHGSLPGRTTISPAMSPRQPLAKYLALAVLLLGGCAGVTTTDTLETPGPGGVGERISVSITGPGGDGPVRGGG